MESGAAWGAGGHFPHGSEAETGPACSVAQDSKGTALCVLYDLGQCRCLPGPRPICETGGLGFMSSRGLLALAFSEWGVMDPSH